MMPRPSLNDLDNRGADTHGFCSRPGCSQRPHVMAHKVSRVQPDTTAMEDDKSWRVRWDIPRPRIEMVEKSTAVPQVEVCEVIQGFRKCLCGKGVAKYHKWAKSSDRRE